GKQRIISIGTMVPSPEHLEATGVTLRSVRVVEEDESERPTGSRRSTDRRAAEGGLAIGASIMQHRPGRNGDPDMATTRAVHWLFAPVFTCVSAASWSATCPQLSQLSSDAIAITAAEQRNDATLE